MKNEQFPYQLTEFIKKINAAYDGDPRGDFVMAEDINQVQEALTRVEKSIGIKKENDLSIEDRMAQLKGYSSLKINSVGYFDSLDSENISYVSEVLSKFNIIVLNKYDNKTKELSKIHKIYGRINVLNKSINEIQIQIGEWQNNGAKGIYIDNLNLDSRVKEINIYKSVLEKNLEVIISGDISKLLTNELSDYNPRNEEFPFEKETTLVIKSFGYNSKRIGSNYLSQEEIMNNLYPLVKKIKGKQLKIFGMSETPNRDSFNFVQALGLMMSIDFLYTGISSGSQINNLPYSYDTHNIVGQWKTNKPEIFSNGGRIYRIVSGGSIEIDSNNKVYYPGLTIASDTINWIAETVDGRTNKIASIPPNRLTTYDIKKIVDLINSSSDDIVIKPNKIDSDEASGILPESIGASHMVLNVIHAINKKNNVNTIQKQYIEDSAILNLSSNKLIGDIETERLLKNAVNSINKSSTGAPTTAEDHKNFINIPYAIITNLKGSGTINYATFNGEEASFRNATIGNTLTSNKIVVENKLTSPDAEIGTLKSNVITVSKIEGIQSLKVENLEAANIGALVISAIDAKISSGYFNSIVTESLKSKTIVSDIISATTSFADFSDTDKAKINSLITNSITSQYGFFNELFTGLINTDKIEITSDTGVLNINSDTIKIYDAPGKKQQSDIRILIGNLSEATGNLDDYGFMALDSTGKNKIFDHTGVYEGGIHKDSITTDKIKDNSVTGGKIKHDSIIVEHLQGKIITGDWIAGETISGDKIIGKSITAKELAALSIETEHLQSNIIESNHIRSNVIESKHIKSGSILTSHLKVGFEINLMKDGMDSFEQYKPGRIELNELNKDVLTYVQTEDSFEGEKSLRAFSLSNNIHMHIGKKIGISNYLNENKMFAFSSFIRTPSHSDDTKIKLGFMLTSEDKENEYVLDDNFTSIKTTYKRYSFILKNSIGYTHITPIVVFESSNDTIIMDALQVEAIDAEGEISPWRTTATTIISGDSITTGKVNAKHIKIGEGTIFGDGNVIEITDTGLTAHASKDKNASIGADGIVINGGAFKLNGGQGRQTISIDGDKGITVGSLSSKVIIDNNRGFRIHNIEKDEVVFDINPSTQNLRFSGAAEFFTPGSPETSITFQEQQDEIKAQHEEAMRQAEKLQTQEETLAAQQKLIKEQEEEIKKEKQKILEQQKEIGKERMLRLMGANNQRFTLSLELKVGYSSYNERNENFLYVHGYELDEDYRFINADVPGQLYSPYEDTYYEIKNQQLDLTETPLNTPGYIIWDNTRKELDFIYMDSKIDDNLNVEQEWIKTKKVPNFDFNESVFVIGEAMKGA